MAEQSAAPRDWRYLIALGSNMRHHRYGDPREVLGAALRELDGPAMHVEAVSQIVTSAPLGPSRRRFANGAALVRTALAPLALLAQLKALEKQFGRRRSQRWAARVIDLDIILWEGGRWQSAALTLPHPAFRLRAFVLDPARQLAPRWRDPVTGLTMRQLHSRLTRRPPVPRARQR